ncbi:phage tail tube protein [Vermiculatibacterium agrestimuris]|uniref:phage tail tube protein n=1 Tax=Vermiculatibacterium agrestimuris TaxID=2941519 RepID=UPI00203E34D7|nr:phage tail tube protein [Vermiculatibacterium agrestimuris]
MARTVDSAKRVMSGTYGELWCDGEKIAEVSEFQAKVTKNKETVIFCGQIMEDAKMISAKGAGSMTIFHVDSGFLEKEKDVKKGVDRRYTLVSKLADPDSWGAERVSVSNVSLDDLTLADWAAARLGSITKPFTFSDYDLLDLVEVR